MQHTPTTTGRECKKRPREGPGPHETLKEAAAKRRKELDAATQQLRDAQRAWGDASLRSVVADSEVRDYPRRLYFSSDPENCPTLPTDIISAILEPVAWEIYKAGVVRNNNVAKKEAFQTPVGTLHLRRYLHPVTLDRCRMRMVNVSSGPLAFLLPWLQIPTRLNARPWKSAEYYGSLKEAATAQFTRRFRLGGIQLLVFGRQGLLHFKASPGVLKTRWLIHFSHGNCSRWKKHSDGNSMVVPYATLDGCEVGYGGSPKRVVYVELQTPVT